MAAKTPPGPRRSCWEEQSQQEAVSAQQSCQEQCPRRKVPETGNAALNRGTGGKPAPSPSAPGDWDCSRRRNSPTAALALRDGTGTVSSVQQLCTQTVPSTGEGCSKVSLCFSHVNWGTCCFAVCHQLNSHRGAQTHLPEQGLLTPRQPLLHITEMGSSCPHCILPVLEPLLHAIPFSHMGTPHMHSPGHSCNCTETDFSQSTWSCLEAWYPHKQG